MNRDRDPRQHDPGRDERFVQEVLARTSGSGCSRALAMLPDLAEQGLPDLDRRLVQTHLEHCASCRAVAVVLGWLGSELPALAVVDPGPAFTARVLAATSTAAAVQAERRRLVGAAGLMDRLGRWWGQQILRPYFPLQVAYAATVILVLLTAGPWAPLRGLPDRALQAVQAGPGTPDLVGQALDQAAGWAETRVGGVLASGASGVQGRVRRFEDGWRQRITRTAQERADLRAHLGALSAGIGPGELDQAGTEILAVGKALRGIWHDWWHEDEREKTPEQASTSERRPS